MAGAVTRINIIFSPSHLMISSFAFLHLQANKMDLAELVDFDMSDDDDDDVSEASDMDDDIDPDKIEVPGEC